MEESYVIYKQAQRSEHLAFDVESWFPLLADLTFNTTFVDLSPDQATAVVKFYGARYNHRDEFTDRHECLLQSLRSRIAEELKLPPFQHGAFVRMSSRSPKDGSPFRAMDLEREYQNSLTQILKSDEQFHETMRVNERIDDQLAEANRKMRAISRASSNCWRVQCADDAMSLILSSERVFVDLHEALVCFEASATVTASPTIASALTMDREASGGGSSRHAPTDGEVSPPMWTTRLSVRAWDERLEEAFEFRCFVHRGSLVALSQYNHYCVYPEVLELAMHIHDRVTEFCVGHVMPRLSSVSPYSEGFIVDIGMLREAEECVVIELNPYKKTTGAALFDWSADSALLLGEQHSNGAPGAVEGSAHGKSRAGEDERYIEFGTPPLRLQTTPMEQLPELVEVMMSDSFLAPNTPETYLDVLEKLRLAAEERSFAGGSAAIGVEGTHRENTCVCQ